MSQVGTGFTKFRLFVQIFTNVDSREMEAPSQVHMKLFEGSTLTFGTIFTWFSRN